MVRLLKWTFSHLRNLLEVKLKIIASYIIHYGREWLNWSMRSVESFVDDIFVFYTPKPSHGHATTLECPDSREELFSIAARFSARWYDGTYAHEGEHRDFAIKTCMAAGADMVLVVDADEVWDPDILAQVLVAAWDSSAHTIRVHASHFWRSVNWICHDEAMPARVIKREGVGEGYVGRQPGFWHFGYAQSPELIQYKMSIHGHKNELRPGWFENKFLAWKPGMGDVHPTNVDFWNPEPFDRTELFGLIGDHPYYKDGIIE